MRAPVSGQVLKIHQTSEAVVALGTPLLELGDTRRLEVVADLLTSDALPWPYRAVGWFAGEGFRGAFAVTNRTHANYSQAKYLVEKHMKS